MIVGGGLMNRFMGGLCDLEGTLIESGHTVAAPFD
jgi:hypothetical protein